MSLSIRALITASVVGSVLVSSAFADGPRGRPSPGGRNGGGAPVRNGGGGGNRFGGGGAPIRTAPPARIGGSPNRTAPPVRMAPPTRLGGGGSAPVRTAPPARVTPSVGPSIGGRSSVIVDRGRPGFPGQPVRPVGPTSPVRPVGPVAPGRTRVIDGRATFGTDYRAHPGYMSHRYADNTVIVRGNGQFRYGVGGAGTYVRRYNGVERVIYTQNYGNNGFVRTYPGRPGFTRAYSPIAWGVGVTLFGFRPVLHATWNLGSPSYYDGRRPFRDWCNDRSVWSPSFSGYHWNWGWWDRPWHKHYGYYYRPYYAPSYRDGGYRASHYWLTDWYFGRILSDYYDSRQDTGLSYPDYNNNWTIDDSTREYFANQVVLSAMNDLQAQRQVSIAPYLSSTQGYEQSRLYVVSEYTPSRVYGNGYTCVLTPGDIVQQASQAYPGTDDITVKVFRSKNGSCRMGEILDFDISQLQEYQNDLYETIEDGLDEMQGKFFR